MTTKFKYYPCEHVRLGMQHELFQNLLTQETVVVPKELALIAALCTEPAELREHAVRVNSLITKPLQDPAEWEKFLVQAVESQLLLSLDQVRDYLLEHLAVLPQRRAIDMIGIPTRNRPAQLEVLLSGLSEHLARFHRSIELLVIDDSESEEMQVANQRVLAKFEDCPEMRLCYGNREMRKSFAHSLAEYAGLPPTVVSFALCGDDEYPVSVGACRNSILLDSAGHCLLYLDDDVQCRLAAVPGARQGLSFRADNYYGRFFTEREEIEACEFVHEDLLGAHEQVLNMDRNFVERALAGPAGIDVADVPRTLLKRIAGGNATVVASFIGLLGDAAMDDPLPYFVHGPATLAVLAHHEALYRAALRNRLIFRGPRATLITDQHDYMSYCMGIDNTDLLPPFMPVQRGEELVFGTLLSRCVPGALFGTIPRVVLHQPGEPRDFGADAALRRIGKFTVAEMICCLIRADGPKGGSRAELMISAGQRLRDAISLSDPELRGYLRRALEPILVRQLQALDMALEKLPHDPNFWVEDVLQFKATFLEALQHQDFSLASDLEAIWGPSENRRRFRQLAERAAELLSCWPKIAAAARSFRERRGGICVPLPDLKKQSASRVDVSSTYIYNSAQTIL